MGSRRKREPATSVRRVLPAPTPIVFGVLSDTNRWDRLIGVTPSRYTYELIDPADPTSRTRIGHARFAGLPLHFAEEGEYWAGVFLRGERRFRGAMSRLFDRGFLELRCEPLGPDRTEVRMRVGCVPTVLGWIVLPFTLLHMAIVLRLYLRSVARAVAASTTATLDAPPAAQARRALLTSRGDAMATGPRTQVSRALVERIAQFAAAPVAESLRRRVIAFVSDQPDEALAQIQPLEIALVWGEDGRETIRGFLHATRAGLFDLEWQIDCPSCRVATASVPRLDSVRGRIHCDECDISFDVDFAQHVHATFTVSPAVRKVARVVYCATSPYFRPHVHGYLTIAPGATRDVAPLPDGDILLRARGTTRSLTVERRAGGIAADVEANAIRALDAPIAERALRVTNHTAHPVRLQVERAGWEALRARGSLIVTIPGFADLFGTDAPAAGLPLEIGRLAVLFTDLVGSVDLYNRIGDARAFALVQEHWRDATEAIAARNGAVVKTLGDGVLAAFAELPDAVAAALDVMAAAERLTREHDVAFAIRAGCHEGPCFVVRANGRIDLFGSTVNLASRLAGAAGGQQLALVAATVDSVRDQLVRAHCDIDSVTTKIRGLPGDFHLVVATRAASRSAHTGPMPALVS